MKVSGLFLGTGSALRISLGFVPDAVIVRNVAAADLGSIVWNKAMKALAVCPEGVKYRDNSKIEDTPLTVGGGIAVYVGGDVISSASTGYQTFARYVDDYAGDMRGKGTLGLVDKFTLTNAGNRTGKFNHGVNTTYVGVGSKVIIGNKTYVIQAITADGDEDDQVTLDAAAPSTESGGVQMITYKHDFVSVPAGSVTNAGIVLSETADVNVGGELCYIEAEIFDN